MHSKLITNRWFGKAVGFTAAFVLSPDSSVTLSLLVIAGVACGHLFDTWATTDSEQKPARSRSATGIVNKQNFAPVQLQFLFTALGRVAKQSGRVTARHIDLTEQLMGALELNRPARQQAIKWFEIGKDATYPIAQLAQDCRKLAHQNTDLAALISTYMCRIAAVAPSDQALATTVKLAGLLNVDPSTVAREFGAALHPDTQQKNNRQKTDNEAAASSSGPANSSPKTPLQLAYEELDVSVHATPQEVKTAYRRQISKHHPDKLGPKASTKALEYAKQRMVSLRQALETIEAHRR